MYLTYMYVFDKGAKKNHFPLHKAICKHAHTMYNHSCMHVHLHPPTTFTHFYIHPHTHTVKHIISWLKIRYSTSVWLKIRQLKILHNVPAVILNFHLSPFHFWRRCWRFLFTFLCLLPSLGIFGLISVTLILWAIIVIFVVIIFILTGRFGQLLQIITVKVTEK